MKNLIVVFLFSLISCVSKNRIVINNTEKEKTLNVLLLSFIGNDGYIYYNSNHFNFPCIPRYEKQIKYSKKEYNRIINSKKSIDLVFVENDKNEFKDIEKFLPYNENKYQIHLESSNHCVGLKKFFLAKRETYDEIVKLDKHFLKINDDDKKIRLHFIYKDSLNDFQAISNWFEVKE